MDLLTFKNWQRKHPFWLQLKWYKWTTQKIKRLSIELSTRHMLPEDLRWHQSELEHQMDRQDFLYLLLVQKYEQMEAERNYYKKMALRKGKKK